MLRAAFLLVALGALGAARIGGRGRVPAHGRAPLPGHPRPRHVRQHGPELETALRPLLEADGFCVFSLDYGNNATAPMAQSGDTVAAFARQVLAQTGAAKVSFVGHSQGGSLSRYVAKDKGLLAQTDDIVGLAPSSHGTTNPFAGPAALLGCASCSDQMAGSPFMQALNTPPEAPGPVSYTVVSTRYDEVVTPYQSQALAGDTVTNIVAAGPLRRRPHRARRDHLRPGGAAVGARRAAARGPGQPGLRPGLLGEDHGRRPVAAGTTRAARRSRRTWSCAAPRCA